MVTAKVFESNRLSIKKDELLVVAVGVGDGSEERVEALKSAGVDVIVVDTAHAHTEVINQGKSIKNTL